ncbi:hypothetical protein [Niveispirillum sp. KHB5.9]|uniref:hypothetical protein n=1 Tax=Niveispirillum sp. KHB5.9 TaxID=3400269 RepID=UPI003A879461
MRRPAGSILISAALCLLLTACAAKPPPAGPRQPASLSMGKVLVDLPIGHKAGTYEWGWACESPFNDVAWITEGRIPGLLVQAARDGLGWGGLSPTDGAGRVLTGRLVDVDLSLCRKVEPLTRVPIGDTGEGRVRIDWELTDPPNPVQRFTTQGQGETDIPSINGRYDVILRNAMADAARRLAALPEFRALATMPPGGGVTASLLPPTLSTPLPPAPPVEPEAVPEAPAAAPGAALVRWGAVTGVVVDARGLVLLPDTGADLPSPLPLMLADGRVVPGSAGVASFGIIPVRLPDGDWPALAVRRQRPGVSHWLHRSDGDGGRVAMVAAHTGPARAQGTDVPSLLLDLDEALWRDPPWLLLDDDGRLAALRGPRTLPGDPTPYYAPAGVTAYFREAAGMAAP